MGLSKRAFTASRSGSGSILQVRARTFLDRPSVIESLEAKYLTVMARLGGYIRTTMQRSMRYRKKASKPGQPPTSRRDYSGNAGMLRSLIEFGYDRTDHMLVVGPQKIQSPTLPLGGKSVPQLLDQGGAAYVYQLGGKRTLAHYEPRPFVQPAVEKGLTKFRELLSTVPLIQTKGR